MNGNERSVTTYGDVRLIEEYLMNNGESNETSMKHEMANGVDTGVLGSSRG